LWCTKQEKLNTISVKGEAEGGMVIVYVNGNRRVTDIQINKTLMEDGDKEAIEELLQVALNKALESADSVNEMELASAARGFMPGF
jgi:DNA-binding YbaB/EbfC family protein